MRNLFFSLSLLVLSACSNDSFNPLLGASGGPLSYFVKQWDFETAREARDVFRNSNITCESQNDCPASAAALYIRNDLLAPNRLGACSAELMEDGRVITNAHCIPGDIAYEGASCLDRIKVKFPKSGVFADQRVDCHQVIAISDDFDNVVQPDWAIISLVSQPNRPGRKVKPRPIESSDAINIYKINFEDDLSRGTLIKASCLANQNHRYQSESLGPVSPIMTVSSCDREVIKGNSGSGMIDEHGYLVGVFSYIFSLSETGLKSRHLNISQNFGGGTNLYCNGPFVEKKDALCEYQPSLHKSFGAHYRKLVQLQTWADQWSESSTFESLLEESSDSRVKFDKADSTDFDNIQFEDVSELSATREHLLKKKLIYRFPALPSCVSSGFRKSFSFEIKTLTPTSNEKLDESTFSAELESRLDSRQIQITQLDSESYQVVVPIEDDDLPPPRDQNRFEKMMDRILGRNKSPQFIFKVPSCESLSE